MKIKSIFFGFITGATIASVTTLLTTPTSGRSIQIACKDNLHSIQTTAKQLSKNSTRLRQQLQDTTKVSVDSVKAVSIEVKESVNQWKQEIEPSLSQLKKDIDSLRQTVEDGKVPSKNISKS